MKLRHIIAAALVLSAATPSVAGKWIKYEPKDSAANAVQAFLRIETPGLELLRKSTRLDMADYLKEDSIYHAQNALEGESFFLEPVTKDFLRVRVTASSTYAIRLLPAKKGEVVVGVYTIGDIDRKPNDSIVPRAGDSQLDFFDSEMRRIETKKMIKVPRVEEFLEEKCKDKNLMRELMELIPFPTVVYSLNADNTDLTATLTIDHYMGREDFERIRPYLTDRITYHWTGKRYERK